MTHQGSSVDHQTTQPDKTYNNHKLRILKKLTWNYKITINSHHFYYTILSCEHVHTYGSLRRALCNELSFYTPSYCLLFYHYTFNTPHSIDSYNEKPMNRYKLLTCKYHIYTVTIKQWSLFFSLSALCIFFSLCVIFKVVLNKHTLATFPYIYFDSQYRLSTHQFMHCYFTKSFSIEIKHLEREAKNPSPTHTKACIRV